MTSIENTILSNVKGGLRLLLVLFLAGGFLGIGMLKLVSMPELVNYFTVWEIPLWVMYVVGLIEVVLSIMVFYLPTRKWACYGIIVLMVGATVLHISQADYSYIVGPSVIILATLLLLWITLTTNKIKSQ